MVVAAELENARLVARQLAGARLGVRREEDAPALDGLLFALGLLTRWAPHC